VPSPYSSGQANRSAPRWVNLLVRLAVFQRLTGLTTALIGLLAIPGLRGAGAEATPQRGQENSAPLLLVPDRVFGAEERQVSEGWVVLVTGNKITAVEAEACPKPRFLSSACPYLRASPFGHEREHFRSPVVAMLDGIDPGQNRPAHPLRGRGMGGHQPARGMGFRNQRLNSSALKVGTSFPPGPRPKSA
jgi:hypothetical protein